MFVETAKKTVPARAGIIQIPDCQISSTHSSFIFSAHAAVLFLRLKNAHLITNTNGLDI